jgi:hypothetical protein
MGHRRDMPRVGAKVGPQQSPGFGPCCGSRIGTHRKGTPGNPILWHRTNSPTTHHVRISIVKTRSQPIGGAEGARATGTLRNRFDKHKWSNGWHRPTFRLIQLGQKCRICREKRSALGRTRTCDLLIRRPNWAVLCGSLRCAKGDSYALFVPRGIGLFCPAPVLLPSRSRQNRHPVCR